MYITQKRGEAARTPPFFSFTDGSVPSTGQRRPGLPRAGPAVLSARWGLASGFGTGPSAPPCSGRYHLIEDEDVTRARVRELAIKYYPTVEESTRRLPRDLPASSSSRSRSSISPASRSRRYRATKPQTITGTQARALLPAKLEKANRKLEQQLDLIAEALPGGVKISNDDATYSFKYVSEQFVEEDALQQIREARLYAPSAGGRQGPVFVVCQDRAVNERLGKIKRANSRPHMAAATNYVSREQSGIVDDPNIKNAFYDAPTVITLFGPKNFLFAVEDCMAAAENMILAADALGIASCCIGQGWPAFNDPTARKSCASGRCRPPITP